MDCFAEECDEWLDVQANARLVKNAEAYYRMMHYGSAESWNLRDTSPARGTEGARSSRASP